MAAKIGQATFKKANELRTTFLECPICLEEYNDIDRKPRLLPCLHSLCDKCLKSFPSNDRHRCHECRAEHPVERNFANIPFDRTRRSLAEFVKVMVNFEIICENCDGQQRATHRCRECELFFCKECLSNHQSMRNLRRKHTVFSLQLGPNEEHNVSDFANQQYCEEHEDQRLSFYCSGINCKTPICQTCYTIGHSQGTDHDVKDIGVVYEDEKQKLVDLARSVEGRALETQSIESDVKETQRELKSNTQKAINAANTSFDNCLRILERRRDYIIQTIKAKSDQKLKRLVEQEQELFSFMDSIKSDSDFLRQTLTADNKAGLLTIAPSITRKFQILHDQTIDKQPVQTAHIEFATGGMRSNFTNCVETLGDVTASLLYAQNTRMVVPIAPKRNHDYDIEVCLFDYDQNAIALDNEDVLVAIKPPTGNVTMAACVKSDNDVYRTSWRPLLEGLHLVTSFAFNGKTELSRKEVNVDAEEKNPAVERLHSTFPNVSIDGIISCLLAEGGNVEKAREILLHVTTENTKNKSLSRRNSSKK